MAKTYTAESIIADLNAGTEINIPGVLKISIVNKPARTGINPATGDKIQIAAHRAPKVTVSAKLKKMFR